MGLVRQHLIDPEVCIRCNTCEETCPVKAIKHDSNNYVVMYDKCNWCGDCFSPCPTGAITAVRMLARPLSDQEQFKYQSLPEDEAGEGEAPEEVAKMTAIAAAGAGKVSAPRSAPTPSINLYDVNKPAVATVAGNMRLTAESAESDIRHIVLDFGIQAFPVLEGQSIGIVPPGEGPDGKPHWIRLYSVASPRDGERPGHNNLALTIKRVPGGIGSNYMCDLKRGDQVRVTGPFGGTFLMPDDPAANIVMICTGTGAAPFRAMTERRRRTLASAPGRLMLFFGARTRGELPYFGPLMKLPKSLIDVELALSREPGQAKQYVQDRLRARADDLAALLKSDTTHIYICGLKGMEAGCKEALTDIAQTHGLDWRALEERLKTEGRFHIETY